MYVGVVGFLIGIVLLQILPTLLPLYWFLILIWQLAILWYFLPSRFRIAACFLFMLCLGFAWATLFAQHVLRWQLSEDLEGKTVSVIGVVASLPEKIERRVRFEFELENINDVSQKKTKVLLSWYNGVNQIVRVGEKWQLNVRLKRPHGLLNPGGFDYEKWLFQKRIRATGYVVKHPGNQRLDTGPWRYMIDQLRQDLSNKIEEKIRDEPAVGMIVALVMGLQKGITAEQWEVMRSTGTNHLMAISGMHIGFVAGFMYMIVSKLWCCSQWLLLRFPAMQAGALGGFLMAVVYASMAGFSLPTQRALVMLCAFLLGLFFRRVMSVWQAFVLALWAVLLWDPLSTFSISFWLSFGAVFAILFGMSGRVGVKSLWWKYGRVQWVVTLALMPLCLCLFQQASLVSFFANMFAVPVVGFLVLPLSLSGALCVFIYDPLAQYLLFCAAKVIDVIWWVLGYLGNLKFAVWQHGIPTLSVLFFSVLGVFILIMPRGVPPPIYLVGLCCFLPLFFHRSSDIKFAEVSFTLLDVGQGLSVFIQTQHHTLLFDTGPGIGSDDTGTRVILPFLQARAVVALDKIIISHEDNDHIGGAWSVLEKMPAGEILTSVPEKFDHQHVRVCEKGMHWQWDGVDFKVLYPTIDRLGQGNNSSCVLKISVGEQAILLTGDIEKAAEAYLLKNNADELKADVIVAPHHGSKTSSTSGFVNAVQPRYVLYPTGYRNRYRFPNQGVFDRYDRMGAVAFDTAQDGAVMLMMRESGVDEPVGYRQMLRRFWY